LSLAPMWLAIVTRESRALAAESFKPSINGTSLHVHVVSSIEVEITSQQVVASNQFSPRDRERGHNDQQQNVVLAAYPLCISIPSLPFCGAQPCHSHHHMISSRPP
jgi:hypothetical protein